VIGLAVIFDLESKSITDWKAETLTWLSDSSLDSRGTKFWSL
jgi:hypothetical protein